MFGSFGPQGFGSDEDFGANFAQNFRSFHGGRGGNFFEEIIRRMQEAARNEGDHARPADRETVAKLPIVKIEAKHCKLETESGKCEPPTCSVCMDTINIGKEAIFMPCGHSFHPDCLMPWLKDHNTCPVCRFELPVN